MIRIIYAMRGVLSSLEVGVRVELVEDLLMAGERACRGSRGTAADVRGANCYLVHASAPAAHRARQVLQPAEERSSQATNTAPAQSGVTGVERFTWRTVTAGRAVGRRVEWSAPGWECPSASLDRTREQAADEEALEREEHEEAHEDRDESAAGEDLSGFATGANP